MANTDIMVLPSKDAVLAKLHRTSALSQQVKAVLANNMDAPQIAPYLQTVTAAGSQEGSVMADDYMLAVHLREIARETGLVPMANTKIADLKPRIAAARRVLGFARPREEKQAAE